jgi:rhamnogalacturonyl hydrolase YesR
MALELEIGVISPQDWGLPVALVTSEEPVPGLDASLAELERRIRANTVKWLPRQFDDEVGAFYGFYRAPDRYREPPQTVNLIAPWQCLAAFDRYDDEWMLEMARRAADWFYHHFVASHPMSVVAGGVRIGEKPHELWTKFSAEYIIGALGLYDRTEDEMWLERAQQSGRYLIQAARHNHAARYNLSTGRWTGSEFGWQSFGRAVEACLLLERASGDPAWRTRAEDWGQFGLSIQAADGCFYLIDEEYYNTDIAADELRGLTFLYELTDDPAYLEAAQRFADWHLAHQRKDGAWPLTVDCDGNVVVPTVGPGDVPNIGIALLRLHAITGDERYRKAALRCIHYSLTTQAVPGSRHPYLDDHRVQWGFWSWDPPYDYTMSGDQSTHHVRGMMFLLDYLAHIK